MSSYFTTADLLALAPQDLYDLMQLAGDCEPGQRAAVLGLDCSDPVHRAAVEKAYALCSDDAQPFSPPIGAGQPGVRSNLTPTEPDPAPPVDADDDPDSEALSLPEPDPEAAAGMAELLAATAGTGVPFLAGTFALYSHPSGGVVMVTETNASGIRRDIIPRKAVKLALGLMGGGKRSLLGRMFGG